MTKKETAEVVKALLCTIIDETYDESQHVNFSIEDYLAEGINPFALDGALRMLLAGWESNQFEELEQEDGSISYVNGFNATYGWGSVMCTTFEKVGKFFPAGTTFEIDADETHASYKVVKGKKTNRVKDVYKPPKFKSGDMVRWSDPDGNCSGIYEVDEFFADCYRLIKRNSKGEVIANVEALERELKRAKCK